jgi:hypothetical protein
MGGCCQPNFKRRLTLKLNPDFSLIEFTHDAHERRAVARLSRYVAQALTRRALR